MTRKAVNVEYLTVTDFELIVADLIALREVFTEDIPPFQTRYPGKLEGILEQVRGIYFGRELYPSLAEKAAYLFYALIKNHPFLNGNKRIGVIALYDFLKRNATEVYIDEATLFSDLFKMAINTSESDADDYPKVLKRLRRQIGKLILTA